MYFIKGDMTDGLLRLAGILACGICIGIICNDLKYLPRKKYLEELER